jgi:hypothetical protein
MMGTAFQGQAALMMGTTFRTGSTDDGHYLYDRQH